MKKTFSITYRIEKHIHIISIIMHITNKYFFNFCEAIPLLIFKIWLIAYAIEKLKNGCSVYPDTRPKCTSVYGGTVTVWCIKINDVISVEIIEIMNKHDLKVIFLYFFIVHTLSASSYIFTLSSPVKFLVPIEKSIVTLAPFKST